MIILWNKTLVSLSLLLLSKFPLLCNYRVITGWKQIFIRHKFFMKLKIKSYILYYMLSIFIQCILHSLLLSLTLIFFHRKCGGRRSYCWSIRRIISSSTYSLVFSWNNPYSIWKRIHKRIILSLLITLSF